MGTDDTSARVRPATTQVERVAAELSGRMDRGLLAVGERLPSVRAAAALFGVSKNTAVGAYERLVAAARAESRPGSGFYVCGRRPAPRARTTPPDAVEAVDSVWLLREQLERHYEVRVGDGRPPPAWMEASEIGRHLAAAPRHGVRTALESYGSPYGYPALRERLALTLSERGIGADAGRILLTAGANHALDLIIRHRVAPGEAVLVDSPGYYPLFGKLHLARARIVGVRRGPEGPDLEDLAAKAGGTGARLFFTQSLAHNPTGCSITLPVAHRVLGIAAATGLRIVESDPFADLLPPALPRLAALDQLERVIYVGTFAKTLSASLRTGFIAAEPGLVGALCDLKMVTGVNSSGYVERALHALIERGHYRRHLRRLAQRVEVASARGQEVLARLGLPVFGRPSGGFYLWCALPEGSDAAALSREAAGHGILIAPGSVFQSDAAAAAPMMRVNVAYLGDPRFERFMQARLDAASR